ncbi:hypothetical protein PMAYCL1PPCAC_33377, partial [Pristionchus mayeri]
KEIYVVGGGKLMACEKYDPVTQTWSTVADNLHTGVFLHLSACSGRLFLIGDLSQHLEEYLPEENKWVERAACPLSRNVFPYGCEYVTLPIPASFSTPLSALLK